MSEGAEQRGKEPIEETPGTGSEGGEGERNKAATPPVADDANKEETQRPPEGDETGVGGSGTQDERP
jgi:hypothetical protein